MAVVALDAGPGIGVALLAAFVLLVVAYLVTVLTPSESQNGGSRTDDVLLQSTSENSLGYGDSIDMGTEAPQSMSMCSNDVSTVYVVP